uniref:RNA binding motif protein 28 n=1 Tax=Laticauda laticaudata TaxID=8630 RepID=A0A8C5S2P4_LATLA
MAALGPRACFPGGGMGRTVLVRGLPPSARAADLEREFGQAGPVRRAVAVTAPGGEACTGLGFVSFSLPEDAQRALREIRAFGGRRVSLALARPKRRRAAGGGAGERRRRAGGLGSRADCGGGLVRLLGVSPGPPPTLTHPAPPSSLPPPEEAPRQPQEPPEARIPPKKARLIVRNLSFKCTEGDLKSAFAPFGAVLEASLPRKPDGKLRGFAFVQFRNVLEAGKALKGMNMKEIKERPVAVDWAVAREKFQAAQVDVGVPAEKKKGQPGSAGGSERTQGRPEASGPGRPSRDPRPLSPPGESQDEEQEASSMEQEEEPNEAGSSEGEESVEEEEEEGAGEDPPPKQKQRPSDVAEGRTVFLRNLSFDTEEEELGELLEQFGDLKYVRLVLHPDTEHSKGCAFAQFVTQEAAQKCLQVAQEESEDRGLHLGGRRLRVDLAVSREEAQQLRRPKSPKPTGARNLYLAREGLIRAGTKAAEGVSAADMAKRARFEELKRQKLKDQNVFVSQTRLCIHNLPKSLGGAALRKVMLQAAGGTPGAIVKECRVMRELKGRGQSLGYAFVEFQQPQHALLALRQVNNNPRLFGDRKRPIVEFSLEDGRKLRLKEQRAERSLASRPGRSRRQWSCRTARSGGESWPSPPTGGPRSGIATRAKRRGPLPRGEGRRRRRRRRRPGPESGSRPELPPRAPKRSRLDTARLRFASSRWWSGTSSGFWALARPPSSSRGASGSRNESPLPREGAPQGEDPGPGSPHCVGGQDPGHGGQGGWGAPRSPSSAGVSAGLGPLGCQRVSRQRSLAGDAQEEGCGCEGGGGGSQHGAPIASLASCNK